MSDALVTPSMNLVGMDGRAIVGQRKWFDAEDDVKEFIFEKLGDLDDIELFFNDVLVAKYIRSQIGAGLIAAAETQREDVWQGVIGLVLKTGPTAFVDDANNKFHGLKVERGDWVLYRNSDGWDKDVAMLNERTQFVKCRVIQDAHIRGRVKYPGRLL
jgi:hypothetical protein